MKEFWNLLKESVILQGIITLMVLGTIIYLLATQQSVPNELWSLCTLIVGFFFGSKVGTASGKSVSK